MEDFYSKGYALHPSLIPKDLIDAFLSEYKRTILASGAKFFRQSSGTFERHRFNNHGQVLNPFSEIHHYQNKKHQSFSRLAKKIYLHPNVKRALIETAGFDKFKLMGSMLFHANINTHPHKDSYYLDSIPNGKLLGCWFALEDIDPRAGEFYVVKDSVPVQFNLTPEEKATNLRYIDKTKNFLAENGEKIFIPKLKKGDVFIWSSDIVHGSTKTMDESFSRLSLTAHYIPEEFQFGNARGEVKSVSYGEFEGWKFKTSTPEYSLLGQTARHVRNTLSFRTPRLYNFLKKTYSSLLVKQP
ncbi:MAG: phytanoyl-CoA dioxygenase family protein [Deltaproteobacteria bacterium]|nr:phytanoyl-CoA dioxygenase family protein [Deltaproteobacteria bacterium]